MIKSLLFLTGFFHLWHCYFKIIYLGLNLFIMKHFSPAQLNDYLNNCDAAPILLDVREHWEFDYCNIKDSILIPMGQLPNRLDELDRTKEIIIICHHGIRSRQMGYYMEQMGFSSITNLDGGVEQWAKDVEPTMKRY